ncbi:MAG: hypothetical protein L0Z62_23690 [Gemmataceae bacterium]|nr:hypothetical protein [Gemmataceae bacterium]
MTELRRFGFVDGLLLLLVLAAAAGARVWYLSSCTDSGNHPGPLHVQDAQPVLAGWPEIRGHQPPTELDVLVQNLTEHRWFGGLAPLANVEERTAHTSPGYPWLLAWLEAVPLDLTPMDRTIRWIQALLGTLTAGCYFFFARRAFHSLLVATLTGLFCALHPFWIINTAEIDDGVLSTFLLGACLMLGTRGGQAGGALNSFVYGGALAGLALVRAALLPFAFVAVLWYLLRCRLLKLGWLYALLAFLGFATALMPWGLRNWKAFEDVFPIVDSAYLHLWIGNNSQGTGGPLTEQALRPALSDERVRELEQLPQKDRYSKLSSDIVEEMRNHPAETLQRRLWAGLYFVFGEQWFKDRQLAGQEAPSTQEMPGWLAECYPALLAGTLLGMLVLGLLGWRWTYGWRQAARLAALATVLIPLPYCLSHAEALSGPRLPLDGVLLSYAAFALVAMLPRVGVDLRAGEEVVVGESKARAEE